MPIQSSGGINIGAEVIGLYINLVLYGVELLMVIQYFFTARARQDSKFILLAVTTNLILDSLVSISQCVNMFTILVVDWGENEDYIPVYWSIPVRIFATGVGALIVQGFLTQRYYCLSSNCIVTTFIIALMLLSLSGSLYLGILVSLASSRIKAEQLHDKKSLTIYLASSAATDICITIALTWKLLYQEKEGILSMRTKHIVRRVVAFAIVTGTVTSAVALATLISFLIDRTGGVSPCFGFFLGRVYTITMLFALLFREKLAGKTFMNVDFIDDAELLSMPTQQPAPSSSDPRTSTTIDTEMVFASPTTIETENPQSPSHCSELEDGFEHTQKKDLSLSTASIDVSSANMSGTGKDGNDPLC
ncbi:hypothetical protein BDN70DRAFT_223293 [Pholiota conissans]|uniref:DUF6534 domain-containing protein n=1 Tax=Pholiota conissans TaxID=109636 RepID=A0A9P5YV68_9AGAR|nr:hypothetical protein BDN70DRAFT_223293 [Pholiota conissans]